jgi:hypothetical protein
VPAARVRAMASQIDHDKKSARRTEEDLETEANGNPNS